MSKAVGKCLPGSFFDVGTWSCYTCPKGYQRTANNVEKWDACSKDVPDRVGQAKYVGNQRCPAGSIMDGRNGGECWTCPSGFGRTAAAVNEWNACGKAFEKARAAIFKGKTCQEGAFFDPQKGGQCFVCPQGYLRTAAPVGAPNACIKEVDLQAANKTSALTCKSDQLFDFVDGGSCWSCPDQFTRSWSGIKSNNACISKQMVWQLPKRTMPGLFAFKGVEEIAAQLIAERTGIDAAIENAAKLHKKNPKAWKTEEWDRINKTPWYSPMLATAILKTALEAAKKPVAKRNAAEKELLVSMSKGIQDNRLFVATQAKQAFDNAMRSGRAKLSEQNKGQLSMLFSTVAAPPDYSGIIQGTIGGSAGAAMIAMGVAGYTVSMPSFSTIAPYAGSKVMIKVAENAPKFVAKLTSAGNSMGSVAGAAAGPFVIITTAIMIAQMEIEKFLAIEKMEGQLQNALDEARRPVNLAVLQEKQGGIAEIAFHWAALVNAPTKPGPKFAIRVSQLKLASATSNSGTATITPKPVINLRSEANDGNVPLQATTDQMFMVKTSGMCLDTTGSGKKGTQVHAWDCVPGHKNQMFRAAFAQAGEWSVLFNLNTKMCLSVLNSNKNNGAKIVQWSCGNAANQKWRKIDRGDGWFSLQAKHSNKCLDLRGGGKRKGTKFQQWDCVANTPNQVLRVR